MAVDDGGALVAGEEGLVFIPKLVSEEGRISMCFVLREGRACGWVGDEP